MANKTAFLEKAALNAWLRRLSTAVSGANGSTTNIVVTSSTGFNPGDMIKLTTPGSYHLVTAVPDGTHVTITPAAGSAPTTGNLERWAYTPAAVWVGLFTAAPTDAGGGTEATGGSYARVQLTQADATWAAAAGSVSTAVSGSNASTTNILVTSSTGFTTGDVVWINNATEISRHTVTNVPDGTHVTITPAAGAAPTTGTLDRPSSTSNSGTVTFPTSTGSMGGTMTHFGLGIRRGPDRRESPGLERAHHRAADLQRWSHRVVRGRRPSVVRGLILGRLLRDAAQLEHGCSGDHGNEGAELRAGVSRDAQAFRGRSCRLLLRRLVGERHQRDPVQWGERLDPVLGRHLRLFGQWLQRACSGGCMKSIAVLLLLLSAPILAAPTVQPGTPIHVQPDVFSVQSNATVSSSSSKVVCSLSWSQVSLIINAKGTFTGSPTLTYTLSEVDPGDVSTAFTGAMTTTGAAISAAGSQVLTLTGQVSPCVKVAWTFTGTSITQVYTTLTARTSVTDTVYNGMQSGTVSAQCSDANIQSCGANSTVSIPMAGQFGASVSVPAASTLVTVLKPDCGYLQPDLTTTLWEPTLFDDPQTGDKTVSYTTVSGTINSLSIVGCHGASHLRVRASSSPTGSGVLVLGSSFLNDPSLLFTGGNGSTNQPPRLRRWAAGPAPRSSRLAWMRRSGRSTSRSARPRCWAAGPWAVAGIHGDHVGRHHLLLPLG
jgi:hypothetical protein